MPKSKAKPEHRLGIVNPLTLVGNEIKSILRERSFPFAKVVLLDATGKNGGALTDVHDEPAIITAISDDELEDLDLVFFCGNAEENREWIQKSDELGFIAVDLSQPTTLEEGKPVVAGINLESVAADDRSLISPHPIAIPIALILHQLRSIAKVELCTATVVQPASELDQVGIEELARQTVSVLNVQSVPQEIFGRQLAFNLYPMAERNEPFLAAQIRDLVNAGANGGGAAAPPVALQITQGTIFHSHTFSLFVKLGGDLGEQQIASALKANRAIDFAEGDQEFGTIDAAGKDEVLIAQVRRDEAVDGGFWIWAVCDNLRRSSALNAVLIAEKTLFGTTPAN
jgi:aspartate-semialdehyde dehydrogenase